MDVITYTYLNSVAVWLTPGTKETPAIFTLSQFRPVHRHGGDVPWALWLLKSPVNQLFVQQTGRLHVMTSSCKRNNVCFRVRTYNLICRYRWRITGLRLFATWRMIYKTFTFNGVTWKRKSLRSYKKNNSETMIRIIATPTTMTILTHKGPVMQKGFPWHDVMTMWAVPSFIYNSNHKSSSLQLIMAWHQAIPQSNEKFLFQTTITEHFIDSWGLFRRVYYRSYDGNMACTS